MKNIISRIPFYSYFDDVASSSTFRHSTITLIGTVLTGALGAVFYIMTARFLGPSGFGLFSVAIVTQTLITDIGDLGTDTGLVNFVSRYLKSEKEKADKFLKLAFEVKFVMYIVVLVAGLLSAKFISQKVFVLPELENPLKIAIIGIGALSIFSFINRTLQASQRFWAWSSIQVGINALRVILVVAFVLTGFLTLENTLWVYIAMPFVGFIIGLTLISRSFFNAKNEFSVAKEFFKYNKWVAAFTILAAISSRLDTFISARLLDPVDLGLYSASNQMVRIVPMIVAAMGTVIAPKMASLDSLEKLVNYLKKTQMMVILLAVLGLLLSPIAIWLLPHLFGIEYTGLGMIFIILLISMLIFLISVPVHMAIFYYFSKPSIFFWLSIVHLLTIGILGWYLTSFYGVLGTACTVLIGQLVNFLVPLIWVLRRIRSSYA